MNGQQAIFSNPEKSHTIDDVADSFETIATNGPFVVIELPCLLVQPDQYNVRSDVED